MLHTKFQGHRSSGSGDFFKIFTIYGHGSHVGYVTQLICINFNSYSPLSFQMNFGSNRPTVFENNIEILVICCKFQKNCFELILYNFFS